MSISSADLVERLRRKPLHTLGRALYHSSQMPSRAARRAGEGARHWALARPAADRMATKRGCRILHCLGDSHTRVFTEVSKDRSLLPRTWFDVTVVAGATGLGLANPNSRTNAIEIFRRTIRPLPKDRWLLFQLGEVDCGYLTWYRAQQGHGSVEEEFERSMANYQAFLDGLLADGWSNLVVATPPLPTIENYATWEGLDNMRREVTATIEERTELTLRWNGAIRAWAAGRHCEVLDTEADLLDPRTGLLRPSMKSPDPLDHHLDPAKYAALAAGGLRHLGFA